MGTHMLKKAEYTPSPSNKKDQAPSETLGLFLISGLSLAFSVGLSVALFFSLWLWGSLLRASFLIHSFSYYWGRGCNIAESQYNIAYS